MWLCVWTGEPHLYLFRQFNHVHSLSDHLGRPQGTQAFQVRTDRRLLYYATGRPGANYNIVEETFRIRHTLGFGKEISTSFSWGTTLTREGQPRNFQCSKRARRNGGMSENTKIRNRLLGIQVPRRHPLDFGVEHQGSRPLWMLHLENEFLKPQITFTM